MAKKLNTYSSTVTEVRSQGASQAMLYGTGLSREDMATALPGKYLANIDADNCGRT